jgi:hypothetical protein
MVHPQRVHHFPGDYEFWPEKDIYVRRRYGDSVADLVRLRLGLGAIRFGNEMWTYPSVVEALRALTWWKGEGDPPGSSKR